MLPYFAWHTITLGPITLQVWGLMVALGMLLSVLIIYYRGKARGENVDQMLSLAFWAIAGGLIGGRLFHIIFYEPGFYFSHPLEMLKVWRGGMSSFGGFFGAFVASFIFIKKEKIKRDKLLPMADSLSFAALFGWIVGRFGCVFTHEHIGRLSDSFLAMKFPGGARLDMAVIEILFLLPLAIMFFVIRKRKLFTGFFLSAVLIYYGVLRFILDFFRTVDIPGADARYFGLTPAQYFGIILAIIGVIIKYKKVESKKVKDF